jgi:hypothetical protein
MRRQLHPTVRRCIGQSSASHHIVWWPLESHPMVTEIGWAFFSISGTPSPVGPFTQRIRVSCFKFITKRMGKRVRDNQSSNHQKTLQLSNALGSMSLQTRIDQMRRESGLIRLIEYSYQQGASSFLKAYLKRTFRLSVLEPKQSLDGWPTEKFS